MNTMSDLKEHLFNVQIRQIGDVMPEGKRQYKGRKAGDIYPNDSQSPCCISCTKHLDNKIPNKPLCKMICK